MKEKDQPVSHSRIDPQFCVHSTDPILLSFSGFGEIVDRTARLIFNRITMVV